MDMYISDVCMRNSTIQWNASHVYVYLWARDTFMFHQYAKNSGVCNTSPLCEVYHTLSWGGGGGGSRVWAVRLHNSGDFKPLKCMVFELF